MNELYYRFCILISSISNSNTEMVRLLNELKNKENSEILYDIKMIESSLRKNTYKNKSQTTMNYIVHSDVLDKIQDILIDKTGFSKGKASELLFKNLTVRFPDKKIPPYAKISFASWIDRLLRDIPASELLHSVYSIKRDLVKSDVIDWDLK